MSPEPQPFTDLCALDDVPAGGLHPVAAAGRKLVVARPADGPVAVLDNRCPHEGYPLSQGRLDGGLLTCCWHNWKFAVADGACVLGGEAVAAYPCRVLGGRVTADLAGPDPTAAIPPLLESFRTGVLRHENGRAVRDALRLVQLGLDPRALLLELSALDARHAEYGASHVVALAADCAALLPRLPGPRALEAIAPVIDLCGEEVRRMPERPRAAPGAYAGLDALKAAVEAEDRPLAQGLLGGAFQQGLSRAGLIELLVALNCEHFTDFGHPLIYALQTAALLREGDDERLVADIAFGQLDGLLGSTREDTLPYWGRYQRRWSVWAPRLEELWALQRSPMPDARDWSGEPLRDAVLDGTADEALDALEQALQLGVPAARIACWLVAAAAHRLLRFHVPIDADATVAEGWLWATHRLTFAAAVRQAVELLAAPEALHLLHQTLAFTHSGRPMDAPTDQRVTWHTRAAGPASTEGSLGGPIMSSGPDAPDPATIDAQVTAVLNAISHKDAARAVRSAAASLVDDASAAALRQGLEDLCLRDPLVRPIVVAHAIKTSWCAFRERDALAGLPDAPVPVLAAVRLLASPIVERRVHELVGASIDWVIHGKVPRKLTQ